MLDIGANVGTTCLPRVMLGHVEQVYAAEPEPANFACLVRNTVRNALEGFVYPDRVAIGDRDGTAHLKISEAIGGHAVVDQSQPGTVDVPLRRLDSWLRAQSVDVNAVRFVKIDTQGYEAHVLAGAPQLLAARRAAWQIEFAPSHLRKAGTDPQDLIARLQGDFTHFLELKPASPGPRVHPVGELADALSRITQGFPEILLYHATQAAADTRFTSP
jgi:FkbM family methyltransferase